VRTWKFVCLMLVLILGTLPRAKGQTSRGGALPYPTAATPKAIDRGELAAQAGTGPVSVTLVLSLPAAKEAESLVTALNSPGDPQFHKFLTAQQFAARFAPTDASVAKVIASLAKYGLTAERTTATTLKVAGTAAAMEQAFGVTLHSYEVQAHDDAPGYTYHAPLNRATIPAEISGSVTAVVGLDSRPRFYPHSTAGFQTVAQPQHGAAAAGATGNPPGLWTVTDFANYYDVNPLYNRGLTGRGRTLGIVTLASFTPSDAFAYWKAVGVAVDPNRIRIVNVDGGPGAPSDASGSDETTLDVEQSGGVAPGARIIVYQSPNQDQAWIDSFAQAIECDEADSLSTSWGTWEWFANLENSPVTDPITGETVSFAQAAHQLFLRAAIQGQTLYAASLDGGAYIVNDILGCIPTSTPTSCSNVLSVDHPASDPLITAAGATTLPVTLELCLNTACTPPYYTIDIPHERVWGWDYLVEFCKTIAGLDPFDCGIYPVGSGGGVSIMFDQPQYQAFLPGVQRSQPNQNFVYEGQLYYSLPAYFPGRNVPDISFNGDPETGYIIYYTSSVSGFEILTFYGGTSFVAPQLNGVTALLGQEFHDRLGLLNFPLYSLAHGNGYWGSHPPLHAIAYGNNWFYHGSNGYNPAVGLGTLDVANFAEALHELCY
jgi:kumamolisin